ncbi:MAG: M28 family peptidase [Gemmatimonadaceae bacterium]
MTAWHALALAIALGVPATPAAGQPRAPRLGYTPASSIEQYELERRFQSRVSAASMSELHRPLALRPHPAGSAASADLVRHLETTLRGFGFEVTTTEYQAFLSHPRQVEVTMMAPARRVLSVREPAIPGDPTSSHRELTDGYVAYSASGDADGEVVYVNYGLPDDYAHLERLGVSPRGRIAIARYGRSHRAVKVHTAEQAGAQALILYSDPADDGFVRGTAWPDGYWRGEQMLQRGNAKFSWYWHGDPLTPGVGATPDARRLDPATAPTLPKIPVVVLSWGEARHLLSALGGVTAPSSFRGGVAVDPRVGPGPAAVRVSIDLDNGLRPIRNVVASLRGITTPERSIMLGTHHDAWTFGAVDPGTGMVALLEVAKRLGELARTGWRPKRTMSFAFWDAEEFGLIGSTEYAEQLRAQLQEQLIMYVNTDMYMKGRFDPGGVPSLRTFMMDVAIDLPEGNGTLYDSWASSEWARVPQSRKDRREAFAPDLKPLGSGADFVPFQHHLGIPTLSVEFIGQNGYGFGTYHSAYDSRRYVERVADPGFAQGAALARVLGTLALRMTQAEVLPFRFAHYATKIGEGLEAAERWARDSAGRQIVSLDLAPAREKAASALRVALQLDEGMNRGLASGRLPDASTPALNDQLSRLEQLLTDDDGVAESRWYRHVLHGWNIYALYDGQMFPGLADAIRLRDAARVAREVTRIERALDRMLKALRAALALTGQDGSHD